MDLEELNDVFEELRFGFKLTWQHYDGLMWEIADGTESYVEAIEESLDAVSKVHINVIEHLEQAKKQLKELSSARPRKDALRDCVSALEPHLKYYCPSETKTLEQSVAHIMEQHSIPRAIIRDVKTIWDRIHNNHPDLRHGATTNSDLSEAEALYWIDRILL